MRPQQGERILSPNALHRAPLLLAVAILVLCGAARSAAGAQQGRPLLPHSSYYTVTTRVERASIAAVRPTQISFSAAPARTYDTSGDAATRVAPLRVITRVTTRRITPKPDPIIEFTPNLAPGKRTTVPGSSGVRAVTERVTLWDDVVVERAVVSSHTIRTARPAHVLEGAPQTFAQLAKNTPFHKLLRVYTMEATAYTAMTAKANPTGYTANGMRAKYGIVAVDPELIPLGSHVFIPGYGLAIAADTGGAIV